MDIEKVKKIGKSAVIGLAALVLGAGAVYTLTPRTLEGKIIYADSPACVQTFQDSYFMNCGYVVKLSDGSKVDLKVALEEERPILGSPHQGPSFSYDPQVWAQKTAIFDYNKQAVKSMAKALTKDKFIRMTVKPSLLSKSVHYEPGTSYYVWEDN